MKQALITGGAGGIGQAMSAYFSQNGWKVYSCDIAPQKTTDKNIIPIKMDLTSGKSVAGARTQIEKETDRLDIIINLAGIYIMDSLVEVPEEEFLGIFNINVNGAYRINKEFLPFVKNGGRIIIITSELAYLNPLPFNGIYSITKTTLEAYAQSLRLELMLLDIPVITIRPGPIDTKLLKDSVSSMEKMCKNTLLYRANAAKIRNIMDMKFGRAMSPDNFSEKVYRVAESPHPRASYIVGAGLPLRLFSALPTAIQAALLKKLMK